jgi:molybdate transport system substrate-binding protein
MDRIALRFRTERATSVRVVYGPGPILVAAAATTLRADVLFTADPDDMDTAEKHDLLQPRTRIDLLTSHLSLIAPRTGQSVLTLPGDGMQLLSYLGERGRLAIGNPKVIESGRYAKASLEAMGWWQALAGRLAVSNSVRACLAMVARGEAPLGIAFDTDAAATPEVSVVGTFPDGSHPPIVYQAALAANVGPDGQAFLTYLEGSAAAEVFENAGYTVLGRRA